MIIEKRNDREGLKETFERGDLQRTSESQFFPLSPSPRSPVSPASLHCILFSFLTQKIAMAEKKIDWADDEGPIDVNGLAGELKAPLAEEASKDEEGIDILQVTMRFLRVQRSVVTGQSSRLDCEPFCSLPSPFSAKVFSPIPSFLSHFLAIFVSFCHSCAKPSSPLRPPQRSNSTKFPREGKAISVPLPSL